MASSTIKKEAEPFMAGIDIPFVNFGELSASSVGNNIDTIVDNLQDGSSDLYFSFIVWGNVTMPNMGANTSWWYGYINQTKTYGWIRGESFDVTVRGKRKNASTFTFT